MITELRHHHLKVPEANAFENCCSGGTEKEPGSPGLLPRSLRTRPPLPLCFSSDERERAAVRLLIYLMKIRLGMAVIKTSWLSPAVALRGGNRSEAFRMWRSHGWH